MEIWKQIPGFERYEASSEGRIRSVDCIVTRTNGRNITLYGRVMAMRGNRQGYKMVAFSIDRKRYFKFVHRLVYMAFNGPIPDGLVIDHIDNDKTNNRIENLQAISNEENLSKDSWRRRKHKLPTGVGKNREGAYTAHLYANNVDYYLGTYSTAKEAERAYLDAKIAYRKEGVLPTEDKRIRHAPTDTSKICSCCGKNLPLSDYYISRGRIQGKCKECFKAERKTYYDTVLKYKRKQT